MNRFMKIAVAALLGAALAPSPMEAAPSKPRTQARNAAPARKAQSSVKRAAPRKTTRVQRPAVRKGRTVYGPRLNVRPQRAGTGALRDSARLNVRRSKSIATRGPGYGTYNGLGNGNGGTGIGGGSVGYGVGTGTNPGADVVRPVPMGTDKKKPGGR